MPKKMYVIQADYGVFYCGMRYWDKQLRKAKIYHSLAFAEDVCKDYEECNCKIVEVSLAIVPQTKTHADRIRAMTDEELVEWSHQQIGCGCNFFPCGVVCGGECKSYSTEDCEAKILQWLQQPAEGD
jgi:hypothetical protein